MDHHFRTSNCGNVAALLATDHEVAADFPIAALSWSGRI